MSLSIGSVSKQVFRVSSLERAHERDIFIGICKRALLERALQGELFRGSSLEGAL
jgi:hypothetical protein